MVNSRYNCLVHSRLTKIISLIISFCLILEQSVFAQTIDLSHYFASGSAQAIPQSDKFRPLHLRYISYDNQANDFKILLDKGDQEKGLSQLAPKGQGTVPDDKFQKETQELMKYFFIGLALPNDKFWVNLRPDSPDNILDPELEKTDIGRIFLEADLQLKKDTSGMTSPQTKEGREYWDKLYKKAGELFPAAGGSAFGGGTENITIPTITRPWIVPNEIIIRESPEGAYIYKATLKVMLEEDYLNQKTEKPKNHALPARLSARPRAGRQKTEIYNFSDPRLKELNEYSTQLIKETIIPRLTYEVNASKRYAPLRQVYYSLILAQWFKQKYGSSGSSRVTGVNAPVNRYIDLIDSGNLVNLISNQPHDKQSYFQQYQKSFKDGEYSLKEPVYTPTGHSIRRYVSGGGEFNNLMANSSLIPSLKDNVNRGYIFPAVYDKKTGKTEILTKSSASPVGWSDQSLFDIYAKQREGARPAIKLIVEETMREYLGNALKILEIGSGRGELAGMLSTETIGRIIQSDIVPKSLRHNNSKFPKIAADAYYLPFRNEEMPGIVSFAVLDTFFDIDRAFQEFYRVLKPRGTMIGFIDLLPSHEVMMNYWSDDILFPSFVNIPGSKMIGCRGNLRVSKAELLQKLNDNKAKLGELFIKFMNAYISNPIEQYIYIQQHSDSFQMCEMLKIILNALDINYTETDQLFLFKDILEKAVVRNGFRIAQSNIKTVTLEIDEGLAGEVPLAKNVVYFHTGAKWFDYDATIPDGKVKIVASIYVLAANKKEDTEINGIGEDVRVAGSAVEWVDKTQHNQEVEEMLRRIRLIAKFPRKIFLYINNVIDKPQTDFIDLRSLPHLRALGTDNANFGDGLIQLPGNFLSLSEEEKTVILIGELIKLIYPASYGARLVEDTLVQGVKGNMDNGLIHPFWYCWAIAKLIGDGYIKEAKEYVNYLISVYKNAYEEIVTPEINDSVKAIAVKDFFATYLMCVLPFKLRDYPEDANNHLMKIVNIFGEYFGAALNSNVRDKLVSYIEEKVVPLIKNDNIYPDIFTFEELNKQINKIAKSSSPLNGDGDIINDKGGVDFAALPIQTQAMPGVSSALTSNFKPLTSAQMEAEWAQIEAMVNAAIRPAPERLERYAASVSSSLDYPRARDKFVGLLADILRNDETSQRQPRLEPALKNILLALESE